MRYFILVCIVNIFSFSSYAVCEMPTADAGGGSPATITGNIRSLEIPQNILIVEMSKKKFEIDISNISMPSMVTQFGGVVPKEQLKVGDRVEIWTKNCKIPKSKKIIPGFVRVYK